MTLEESENEHREPFSIELKILEAYTRDVGRGVARIDYDTMDLLNASTGDIIEIKGKRRTVAKCLPLYPSDEGKGIMRFDELGRNNSEIVIGDTITVRKIKAVAAEEIVIRPLVVIPPIDERYIADALDSVPLIKGDNVAVPYFSGRLTFEVIGVIPEDDAVLVTTKTIVYFKDHLLQEAKIRMKSYDFQSALISFDNFLAENPKNVEALVCRSRVLVKLGRSLDAIANYDKLLELVPNNKLILYRKAEAHFDIGEFQNAIIVFGQCFEQDTNDMDILLKKGISYMLLKNQDEAKQCFEQVLEFEPNNDKASFILKNNFN